MPRPIAGSLQVIYVSKRVPGPWRPEVATQTGEAAPSASAEGNGRSGPGTSVRVALQLDGQVESGEDGGMGCDNGRDKVANTLEAAPAAAAAVVKVLGANRIKLINASSTCVLRVGFGLPLCFTCAGRRRRCWPCPSCYLLPAPLLGTHVVFALVMNSRAHWTIEFHRNELESLSISLPERDCVCVPLLLDCLVA